MKKLTALFGSCLFFFIVMSMYLVLDQFNSNPDKDSFHRETQRAASSVAKIRSDVEALEKKLDFSNRVIDTINDSVEDLSSKSKKDSHIKFVAENDSLTSSEGMCSFTNSPSGHTQDIRMIDFFDKIPFDNQDGGVWKQGWDVSYEKNAFDKKTLLVFVMPHSHNDPGWLKTLDQYFREQTVKIISNVIEALAKDEKRKFIWAETSYFSMWWAEATPAKKVMAQEQIKNGQLEIVTGGWVMNDEANPHYANMLDQLVEGHQWMEKHIGTKPKYGWAIDPFGYSSTMPYLLKRMGFEGMLIQRVHYNVKKHLAKNKQLEFMWRQNWDHGKSTDIFTHVMPFYSYDVPHTCGPDPKICCQFDFRRLAGGGMFCPWHIPPREVDDNNVKERAELLLDQYKKKAQLYRSNVVLAPLGDDFRYDREFETRAQFDNYEKLMSYINSHPELKTEIKFGTLSDYFHAVAQREGVKPGEQPFGFPSLGGDFFTYADRDDHYWSGYYTSRSFYKHMDQELSAHLRGAEILFSLALAHSRHHGKFPCDDLYPKLLSARKELALFQHHDGITGTAKDHVVVDYGERMLRAIRDSAKVMETSSNFLLTSNKEDFQELYADVPLIKYGESRERHDSLSVKDTIIISNTPRSVVFYNSLAQERQQVVFVHISEEFVQVIDNNGQIVPHQVSLLWKSERDVSQGKYELSFAVTMPPLGLVKYEIKRATEDVDKSLASTSTYGFTMSQLVNKHFKVAAGMEKQIEVKNKHFTATFDADSGLLTDITKNGQRNKLEIHFMKYGTVGKMDRSGAYLFLPSGAALPVDTSNPPVTVTCGKIYTEVSTRLQYVTHKLRIFHADLLEAQSLDIQNILDIRHTTNFEFVMRIESDVKNIDKEFFTDLNSFQMQRRKTLAKLPLQANFYPVPAMAYIQDKKKRLTIHTQQTNGFASLEQGFLELVLDRRLMQDDNRGLGQGVTDNKITPSNFRLLLENFLTEPTVHDSPIPISYPSALSTLLLHELQYPVFTFSTPVTTPSSTFQTFVAGLKKQLPCDLHLVNLRSLQDNIKSSPGLTTAMFLHRIGYDCNLSLKCSERRLTYQEIFEPLTVKSVEETSLSLMHKKKNIDASSRITVPPMEIQAYKLKLT